MNIYHKIHHKIDQKCNAEKSRYLPRNHCSTPMRSSIVRFPKPLALATWNLQTTALASCNLELAKASETGNLTSFGANTGHKFGIIVMCLVQMRLQKPLPPFPVCLTHPFNLPLSTFSNSWIVSCFPM